MHSVMGGRIDAKRFQRYALHRKFGRAQVIWDTFADYLSPCVTGRKVFFLCALRLTPLTRHEANYSSQELQNISFLKESYSSTEL